MTDDSCLRPQIIGTEIFARIAPSGRMTIPYGETSFTELKSFYKERAAEQSKDSKGFLLDGMTLLSDMRAALLECRKYQKPVYASIAIDGELMTENELPADAALIVMQSMGALCFAVKSGDPQILINAVRRLRPFAKIPLAVYPESGRLESGEIKAILSEGADAFIGLCEESAAAAENIISCGLYSFEEPETEDSIMLANERSAFFLEHDTTEFSEPIECSAGMSEELIEACGQNGYDVLRILVNSPEDVLDFADNAHMATLPVMFCGDIEIAMKHALMLYQGRAMIDSKSLIDPDTMKKSARKYGAVIY